MAARRPDGRSTRSSFSFLYSRRSLLESLLSDSIVKRRQGLAIIAFDVRRRRTTITPPRALAVDAPRRDGGRRSGAADRFALLPHPHQSRLAGDAGTQVPDTI